MRVLLLADSCNPEWAPLPAVGYKACRAVADPMAAAVGSPVRNCEAIENVGMGQAVACRGEANLRI